MYRSEELYNQVKDAKFEIFPICVPSYNRPNPRILKSLDTYPELPIFLFIRNTKEQKEIYKKWKSKCRIICLNNVENIGQTRRAIIDWCVQHRISNIFMVDDDVDELDYLYPHQTSKGKFCMRAARQNTGRTYKGINPFVFRMWMTLIKSCRKDLVLSSPAYRPDSWHMKNTNADIVYNAGACIQCVHINVKELYKHKINYRDTDFCGNEDYALQFDVMSVGLSTCIFKDLMYGCPAIGSLSGGNEDACKISDIKLRYKKYIQLFLENVSGTEHKGIKIKQTKTSGIPSIKFNWSYWQIKEEKNV